MGKDDHRTFDDTKGIRRHRTGTGFRYVRPDGRAVGKTERARIDALAIPPAWHEVWISRDPNGHIQATGRDDKERKQYIYHTDFRTAQDEDKFDRLIAFARALPDLRDALRADLAQDGLPRERVVAAAIRIMERTFTRAGSERHARENHSYGVSTLQNEHVAQLTEHNIRLRFPGKGAQAVDLELQDARVAAVIAECQELPGKRLFEYVDEDGTVHTIDSGDINDYLRETTGQSFTSKDFRTWAATTLMTDALWRCRDQRTSKGDREEIVRDAIEAVAKRLGHTPAVCKESYIHPAVPAAFLDGSLAERARSATREGTVPGALLPEEARTLRLLVSYEHQARAA